MFAAFFASLEQLHVSQVRLIRVTLILQSSRYSLEESLYLIEKRTRSVFINFHTGSIK